MSSHPKPLVEAWHEGVATEKESVLTDSLEGTSEIEVSLGSVVETSVLIVLFLPGAQQRRRVRGAPVSHRATTSKGRRGTIWSALP